MSDERPDLSKLNAGDEVRVYYRSRRSGNEVDRKGEVAFTTASDDGELHWVHTEQRGPLKHQYVVLTDGETTGGDTVVIAQSVTVAADEPNDGDPPKPGWCTVQFTVERTSLLGIVDRVMKNGLNINYV